MSSQTAAAEAPLLRNRHDAARAPALALLLGRAGRRGPSMLVRETAARELEERRADWGYSKPVVALDMSWNMAFVVVSAAMLACTISERPNSPIRVWIVGYALQCLVHVVLVWLEYRRRSRRDSRRGQGTQDVESQAGSDNEEGGNDSDSDVDGSSGNSSRSRCVQFNSIEFNFVLVELSYSVFVELFIVLDVMGLILNFLIWHLSGFSSVLLDCRGLILVRRVFPFQINAFFSFIFNYWDARLLSLTFELWKKIMNYGELWGS